MMQKISFHKMSESIAPLCPRDSRVMHYDANGLACSGEGENESAMPCYRCDYQGCSVHYTPLDGYFSVIRMPDLPQAVEEPGVNLLQCPRHDAWLYRSVAENPGERLVWQCGVEGCDYTRADFGPAWPSS
jgi:hypothetical protein